MDAPMQWRIGGGRHDRRGGVSSVTRLVVTAVVGAGSVALGAGSAAAVGGPNEAVFVSEIHYDNVGADVGEAIEVFGPAGTSLSGWSIVLYNGTGGVVYDTDPLPSPIPDEGGSGFGAVFVNYAVNGIQNGSPDGLALVDSAGVVRQFLSYEGQFTATNGVAIGLTATDIGVAQAGDAVGTSLQLRGSGSCPKALGWVGQQASSFGSIAGIDPSGGCPVDVVASISEIHYDNDGVDANEAVEVTANVGADLTGWALVRYNGADGLAYGTETLSGVVTDQGGGFGTVVMTYPADGLQNGAPDGVALVSPSGAVREFVSYEGSFTAVDGPAAGLTSSDVGVAELAGVAADQSLQRNGATWVGPRCASFGELNDPAAPATCVPPITAVHAVQGAGDVSPIAGTVVTIEGIVVGDHQAGPGNLGGVFVQEEDADIDADAATSEGIFVFGRSMPDVNVGDHVRIRGTVVEFRGMTELTSPTLELLSTGNALPSAATVTFPVPAVSALEAFEGMLGTLPQELVISEYFNYDRFGEIVVALPAPGERRVMSPTALFDPTSPEAAARADLNLRSRITIDDGITTQNPSTVVHPITRDAFTLTNAFRGGDTVTGLTGPIFFDFNLYRILPYGNGLGYDRYTRTDAPDQPDPVGGDLRVAAMNTLNYFLSLDTADTCGPTQNQDCRGADDAGEFARQRPKLLNALEGLDADVIGLVELENTPGVEPLADIAAGLNERFGAGTYAYVAAGTNSVVGTDAIKVGIVYRPAAVTPLGGPAVLDTRAFLDPNNTGADRNRAAVAQSFVDNATGEVFSVVVNHFKSKGSACGEPGEGGLTGSCDLTRTLAAGVLTDWLATSPTGVPDDDWMILGDLNAYDHERPIGVLEGAGYTDLVKRFVGEFAYSFTFDGAVGYLDYALASSSMNGQVTGATEWHINGDEPDLVDYDTSFKSATQDALFDPATPFRSSDHDAVIVGLDLASNVSFSATPSQLWPPNHKLRAITLAASDGTGAVFDVDAIAGTSSEADSGLGADDVPNDIVITSGNLQLRAERFSTAGRTYTVNVVASGGGQVRFGTVTVRVPHSRSRAV